MPQAEWELIASLGGNTAVAKRLGLKNSQTVHNWKARGIPKDVQKKHKWLRVPKPDKA